MRFRLNVETIYFIRAFVLCIMKNGEINIAVKIFVKILYLLIKEFKIKFPLLYIQLALDNVRPLVGLIRKKVAGRFVSIPVFISDASSYMFAIRKFVKIVRSSKKSSFAKAFVLCIIESCLYKGKAVQWQKEYHKVVLESRANIRFLR